MCFKQKLGLESTRVLLKPRTTLCVSNSRKLNLSSVATCVTACLTLRSQMGDIYSSSNLFSLFSLSAGPPIWEGERKSIYGCSKDCRTHDRRGLVRCYSGPAWHVTGLFQHFSPDTDTHLGLLVSADMDYWSKTSMSIREGQDNHVTSKTAPSFSLSSVK